MAFTGDFFIKSEAAEKLILAEAKRGLKLCAGKVGSMSVEDTPVDTSNLRRSEYETDVVDQGDDFIVEIGYEADYAVPVHEILEPRVKHKVGHAKFLEHALKKFSTKYLQTMDKEIKF